MNENDERERAAEEWREKVKGVWEKTEPLVVGHLIRRGESDPPPDPPPDSSER